MARLVSDLTRVDSSSVFRLVGWGARVVLLLFIATQAVLALADLPNVIAPWPTLVALLLVCSGAVVLTLVNRHPYPMVLVVVIYAIVAASTILVDWNLPAGPPGYRSWHWGALTFMLFVLALRDRISAAWIGFGIMAAINVVWEMQTGRGWLDAVGNLDRNAGLLLIATLFAVSLRGAARAIESAQAAQLALAAQSAAAETTRRELEIQLAMLEALARPALERLAAAGPLSDEDRAWFARVETELRDALRARHLLTAAIRQTASEARRRGVEVVLLDDRGPCDLPDDAIARIEEALDAAVQLDGVERITVRLLPEDRDEIATVVADRGDETTAVTIAS